MFKITTKVLYEEEREFCGRKVLLQLVEITFGKHLRYYKFKRAQLRMKKQENDKWKIPGEKNG